MRIIFLNVHLIRHRLRRRCSSAFPVLLPERLDIEYIVDREKNFYKKIKKTATSGPATPLPEVQGPESLAKTLPLPWNLSFQEEFGWWV